LKTESYQLLTRLHRRHGPREFGKICQKLLAIACRLAGFEHVVERGVQGVDLDVALLTERYATEVKTTVKDSVAFVQRDAEGLAARKQDGYQPLLAVLRLRPFSDWHLVRVDQLRTGNLLIASLRPYRHRELEERLTPRFDEGLAAHFDGAWTDSQSYLDNVLRHLGVQLLDTGEAKGSRK
jgi:hypothetical protein